MDPGDVVCEESFEEVSELWVCGVEMFQRKVE